MGNLSQQEMEAGELHDYWLAGLRSLDWVGQSVD